MQLRTLLPAGATPILVTDAGFRGPWFRAVRRVGWDYVGRVRHRTRVQLEPRGPWVHNRDLHRLATPVPTRYDSVRIVANRPWTCDLVFYRKPPQGRACLTKYGMPNQAKSGHSHKARGRAQDPWLLATSLLADSYGAQQIVALYSLRMQIESSFRDLKCERFGCGFTLSLTRSAERLMILLLLHALACFVAWLAAAALLPHAPTTYGGIVSRRPRAYYSRLRVAWEALRRHDPECADRRLWSAFTRPPDWLLRELGAVPLQ